MSTTTEYILTYKFDEDSTLVTTLTPHGPSHTEKAPEYEVTSASKDDPPVVLNRKHGGEVGRFNTRAKGKGECTRADGRVVERLGKGSVSMRGCVTHVCVFSFLTFVVLRGMTFVFSDGKKYKWKIQKWKKIIEVCAVALSFPLFFSTQTPCPHS